MYLATLHRAIVRSGVLFLGMLLYIQSSFAQQTIDFEGLTPGQVVSTVTADGGFGPISVVGVNHDDPAINAAIIFDSDCTGGCTGEDPDLGSPNSDFGGPGHDGDNDPTMGGNQGSPFQNDKALGNILIIHDDLTEIVGNQVADPDDDMGKTSITITFPEPVTMYSFDMIDRENNESQNVTLYGAGDMLLGMFDTPATGDNGIATVVTDAGAPGSGTEGVLKMVMMHRGSGGLDNVVLLPFTPPPPPPPPPGEGCTYTQGFWKNHPEAWPVDELTLGGVTYTQEQLLVILDTSPRGDKSLVLAHQLIAAKLNVANGTYDMAVADAITSADMWLATNGGVGSGVRNWYGGEDYKDTMDDYNNGRIGPGHCDSGDDSTSGSVRRADSLSDDASDTPTFFELRGNYPNPFNPTTTITFSVKESAQVYLAVYDMLGRELKVLANGVLSAGNYEATFDAGELPSGTYLYRLVTPEGNFTNKMVLAK